MANNAVSVKGLSELHDVLKNFPIKLEAKIMRGGLRAGGKVFLDSARSNVPKRTSQLRNSIRMSGGKDASGTMYSVITAGSRDKVYNSKGRPIKNEPIFEINPSGVKNYKTAFYAHMVEFGTRRHFIKPATKKSLFFAGLTKEIIDHPGAKQKPFMRPAYDKNWNTAIETMAEYIRKRIDKEGKKL